MEVTISKTCLTCYKPLRGRIDKKFCDDYCRSTYNNRINSEGAPYLRLINSALKKNRRLLEDLFPPNETAMRLQRIKLLEKGYNFKYTTHTWTDKSGHTYTCCYEFGYRFLDAETLLLIRTARNRH